MTHAGTLANLAPPTEATLMRRIEELERVQRETGPALMAAIKPMFAEIRDQVARIDALVNSQVYPAGDSSTTTGFGLTTAQADVTTVTLVVPDGYTRGLATGLGSIFFLNPTASVDYLYSRVYIDTPGASVWGIRPYSMVGPNNGSAALAPNHSVMLTGLSGGQQIRFRLTAQMGFASMSSTYGLAGLSAQVLFLR